MHENTSTQPPTPKPNDCGAPVPRVVHQIWLQGPDRMRGEAGDLSDQCARVVRSKGWEYRLWSEAMLREFPRYAALVPEGSLLAPAIRSNVGRCAILLAHGGLYIDIDTEVRHLPEGMRGPWLMHDNNSVMAAPAGDAWVCAILDHMATPEGFANVEHGQVPVFQRLARAHGVSIWSSGAWWAQGGQGPRYGNHLARSRRWASHVPG